MKKTVLASMVAATAIGFLSPLTSHAFGLGKIDVKSALNEPFQAEIPIAALRPEEKGNLEVRIASEEEFNKAGLNRSILLSQMEFNIVERGGQDLILISSKQAIKEPFLDFLISATAGSGLMLREYTVLLDPPEYVMAESRGAASRSPATQRQTTASTPTDTSRVQTASRNSFSGSSYQVKRSDTLWHVALQTRPDEEVSVHQMMMALLEENPSSFTNNNVNGLRAGVTLQIPARSDITAMSKTAARQAFAEQNEAWKNRNRPATTVTQQAEPDTTETAPATAADTATEPQQMAENTGQASAPEAVQSDARLQLVAPEEEVSSEDDAAPNVTGNDEIRQLTEQLTLAQETIEAQAQENIDFEARMNAMEDQLETMRRLISLKDADLARLQSMLEEDNPELAAAAMAALQGDSDETASVPAENEPGSTAEGEETLAQLDAESDTQEDVTADNNAETAANDDTGAASDNTAAESEAADDAGAGLDTGSNNETTESASPEAEQTQSQQDGLVNKLAGALNLDQAKTQSTIEQGKQFITDNKLPVALGLLLILLLIWLLVRRNSREVTWDEAVRKLDKNNDSTDTASPAVVAADEADNEDTVLADEEQDDQKTVAELVEQADMFVGYADYVQARSALEKARGLEPANTLVAYKLLFVLYKQEQPEAFVELVEQTDFDHASYEWDEVSQWGRELLPGHALFEKPAEPEAAETPVETPAETLVINDTVDEATTTETEEAPDDEILSEEEVTTQDNHIEFEFDVFAGAESQDAEEDTDVLTSEKAESVSSDSDLDDDLLAFDTDFGQREETSSVEDDSTLELDISEQAQPEETLSFDEELQAAETDDSEFNEPEQFDLSADDDTPDLEFDIGELDDIDEAETKLDLAAAYVDMGDPEGARSILNEVLVEGNDAQKDRANEILNTLS
jgi:pilus assembly protein FimV